MNNKAYISGAISNEPNYKQIFQFAADNLKMMGYTPINPVNIRPLFGRDTWLCHVIADIWAMLFCPYVYFINNWKSSRGARVEHWIACALRKKYVGQTDIAYRYKGYSFSYT